MGGRRMTSEQLLFCCYNRSANFFSWACAVLIFFYSNFFFRSGRMGGVKIGSICVSP